MLKKRGKGWGYTQESILGLEVAEWEQGRGKDSGNKGAWEGKRWGGERLRGNLSVGGTISWPVRKCEEKKTILTVKKGR